MSAEEVEKKVLVVLLEGIGASEETERNAVKEANMTFLESAKADENNLYYQLKANGTEVISMCFR